MSDKKAYVIREVENGYMIYQSGDSGIFPELVWVALNLVDVNKLLQEFKLKEKNDNRT